VILASRVCGICGWRFYPRPPEGSGVAGAGELSRVAVAALLSGLVGVWIVAIPLGVHGRLAVERSGGRLTGRGVATTAIVLGVFDMIATALLAVALAS
jgi:hypothetical protein